MFESAQKDRWFLEINGQARSMSAWQIMQSLMGGEIKVTHRISHDGKKWSAICNHLEFEGVIKKIINSCSDEAKKYAQQKDQENLDDKSGFHDLSQITSGIGDQLTHAQKLEELSMVLSKARQVLSEIQTKRKIVIDLHSEDDSSEGVHPDDQDERVGAAPSLGERLKSPTAIAVVLTLILGFGIYFKLEEMKVAEMMKLKVAEALEAKALGDYDKALGLLNEVHSYDSISPGKLLDLTELHIDNGQFEQGIEILEILSFKDNEKFSKASISKRDFLMGYATMKNSEHDRAIKYYKQSLEYEDQFAALYNLGSLYLEESDFSLAEEAFIKALTFTDEDLSPAVLGLFEVALAYYKQDSGSVEEKRLQRVSQLLDSLPRSSPYRERNLLAKVLVSSYLNKPESYELGLQEFISFKDGLPQLSPRAPRLNEKRLSWESLYMACLDFYSLNSRSADRNILFAKCVSKSSKPQAALPYAEYAYRMSPKSEPYKLFLKKLYEENGEPEKAQALVIGTDGRTPSSSNP